MRSSLTSCFQSRGRETRGTNWVWIALSHRSYYISLQRIHTPASLLSVSPSLFSLASLIGPYKTAIVCFLFIGEVLRQEKVSFSGCNYLRELNLGEKTKATSVRGNSHTFYFIL